MGRGLTLKHDAANTIGWRGLELIRSDNPGTTGDPTPVACMMSCGNGLNSYIAEGHLAGVRLLAAGLAEAITK